ncbi:MAG TPA: hypothetical protein ENI23_14350 [bacterium]|nr:hypothetical protein [bacterium]
MDFSKLLKSKKPEPEETPMDKRLGGGIGMVEYPKDGGILTYVRGHDRPFEGLLDKDIVNRICVTKKMIPVTIDWMYKSLDVNIKPIKEYCRVAREVHRVFTIMADQEGTGIDKTFLQMRDLICLFLEFDDAYRFRFQAAFSQLDPTKFKMTENDMYWAMPKPFDFPGKKEFAKKLKEEEKVKKEKEKENK